LNADNRFSFPNGPDARNVQLALAALLPADPG
jgi:hypothetical protein